MFVRYSRSGPVSRGEKTLQASTHCARPASSTAIERALTLKLKWSILYRRALVSRVASSPHRAAINRRQKPLRRVCARLVRRQAKRFAMMLTDCLSQQERRVMTGSQGISRRQVLTIAAGAAGASVTGAATVIGTSTPAQAAKVSQASVKYQDTPKGEQRCENCIQFEAPSTCKTVDGTVAAQGWCMVYAKKPA